MKQLKVTVNIVVGSPSSFRSRDAFSHFAALLRNLTIRFGSSKIEKTDYFSKIHRLSGISYSNAQIRQINNRSPPGGIFAVPESTVECRFQPSPVKLINTLLQPCTAINSLQFNQCRHHIIHRRSRLRLTSAHYSPFVIFPLVVHYFVKNNEPIDWASLNIINKFANCAIQRQFASSPWNKL